MNAGTEQGSAWVVRRVVYLVGALIGAGLVASGRMTQEQVDGWLPAFVELGGALSALGFALAAWRTGPESDNSRPVIPAEVVEDVLGAVEHIVDRVVDAERPGSAPSRPGTAPTAPEPGPVAPVEGDEVSTPENGVDAPDLLAYLREQITKGGR